LTALTEVAASTILVVLGIDAENKPHASKFTAADREIVLRAAGLMAYRVVELSADEVGTLKFADPRRQGLRHRKGVRAVRSKRELYDQLAAKLGTPAELVVTPPPKIAETKGPVSKEAANATADKQVAPTLTVPWVELVVGSTVLARDDENESWFEAIVVSVADDDRNVLRLRWRDYPEERQFNMHRGRVGVIGPGAR
jgi:hypothetical protein